MKGDWRAAVLKFWFGLEPKQWWSGGPELDHRIKQNFLELWTEKRGLPVEAFLTDPLEIGSKVSLREAHAAVPPTVRPSISRVGWPTPAGTL